MELKESENEENLSSIQKYSKQSLDKFKPKCLISEVNFSFQLRLSSIDCLNRKK